VEIQRELNTQFAIIFDIKVYDAIVSVNKLNRKVK